MRVGLISLGCAKNLVDAEIIIGTLLQAGIEITNDPAAADVLIVNTCSFIDSAQEESTDAILEAAAVRDANNRGQALVVSGCLPQRFRDQLPRLLPEVDAFMGIDQVTEVVDIVRQARARRSQLLGESTADSRESRVERRTSRAGIAAVTSGIGNSSPRPSTLDPRPVFDPRPLFESRGESRKSRASIAAVASNIGNSSPRPSTLDPRPVFDSRPLSKSRDESRESSVGIRHPVSRISPRPVYIPDFATPRYRLTPRHTAYLKIAEGCNHPCSFCVIPRIRGSHRSRPPADILAEARALIAQGVREINLISQDATYYGLDLRPHHRGAIASPEKFRSATSALPANAATLATLIRDLNALPGEFWIRLLYTHPAHWTDDLIRAIAECPKVARYIDIPLQHIHHNMLERMRRETSREHIVELLRRLRSALPGVTLRTTFIVGFPGETEACFESLLEFVRETRFERLGVFTYSREDGTRAARMSGQVSARVKQQRREILMATQREIAAGISRGYVGRHLNVLVEGEAGLRQWRGANVAAADDGMLRQSRHAGRRRMASGCLVARGEADAPDIDGRVYVRGKLPIGEFARVRVTGHTEYDLIAEPAW